MTTWVENKFGQFSKKEVLSTHKGDLLIIIVFATNPCNQHINVRWMNLTKGIRSYSSDGRDCHLKTSGSIPASAKLNL